MFYQNYATKYLKWR